MHRPRLAPWLALTLLAGCAPDAAPTGAAVPGRAPLLGKADAADQADHSCQIVLRQITRPPGTNDYQTRCTAGVCTWVWEGQVELGEGVSGAVRVLYRKVGDPTWWQVDAVPAAESSPGFTRYSFSISEHLIGPATGDAELAATQIELMPFVELADGTRLFDHNRQPGAFDNYVLEQSNYFNLSQGPECAPQFARIGFFDSFDEYLTGELRQGAYLVLDYDPDRLPACRGTGWDIVAHVQLAPGGQLVSGSVRPANSAAQSGRFTVKLPQDATSAAIWFENQDASGCQAWDSDFGNNYSYPIWPPLDDSRCKDIEQWTTINSDMPYANKPHCLDYSVDQHQDAGCELYVSGIGDGHMGHYGIPNNWVEVYLRVGPQQGTLLGAGMLTLYHDSDGVAGQRTTFARQVSADTWQSGFIYLKTGYMGTGSFQHSVEQMAFFVDVKRPSGQVVRLWQSRHGQNYGWNDAFGGPTSTKSIPYGSIKYAGDGAGIFDARAACSP